MENHDKHCPEAGNYDRATKNERAREGPSRTREGHRSCGGRRLTAKRAPGRNRARDHLLQRRTLGACLTGATWSSSQAPAVSPQHSARLPSCAARVFCLSTAPGTSRFASRTTSAPPRVLLRQLSDPGAPPQPAVLRRAADGHLGALADGHELAPPAGPRTRTGPAARPRRQSASTLGWAAGSASPRPGRARAAPAAPAPASRPCTCSSARRRPGSTRRVLLRRSCGGAAARRP